MTSMDYDFIELKTIENELVAQIIALEQEAFGVGGMNEWFLPPFIRHGRVFIALHHGTVVAVAEYMRDFRDVQHAYLFGLVVHPAYRRRGIAKQLLSYAHEQLRSTGITSISLTVAPNNHPAVALYEQMGFQVVDFLPNEYGSGNDRQMLYLEL